MPWAEKLSNDLLSYMGACVLRGGMTIMKIFLQLGVGVEERPDLDYNRLREGVGTRGTGRLGRSYQGGKTGRRILVPFESA